MPKELANKDWDILFLHYLGLDHIGHIYGPFNPLIETKLKEMDGIIEQIHTSVNAVSNIILYYISHAIAERAVANMLIITLHGFIQKIKRKLVYVYCLKNIFSRMIKPLL